MTEWVRRGRLLAGGFGVVVAIMACADGPKGAGDEPASVARPILRSWDDALWLAAPLAERPVAYVSMADRRVFVDAGYRDRASWLLDAHISVSTGLWRIPLPGDAPREPITPGDEEREFEELPIGAWDPSHRPSDGDIRIVRGVPVSLSLGLECIPVQGVDARAKGASLRFIRSDGSGDETTREDFQLLGLARRHTDPDCTDRGRATGIMGWAVRD
ncbi:MAG: hypothetical protein OEN56_06730 [Gemmatimonadota bacterium]|nr:hypothetical protein [Gemmatimonadota bacterium]